MRSSGQSIRVRGPEDDGDVPAKAPFVSISVLNWNGLEDTVACVDSLLRITYARYEILLVDNDSTDGSAGVFRERYGTDPHVELIVNPTNLGFAGGSNAAILRALARDATYVLLLNNDTVVAPDFLTELVRALEADPGAAMAGPKIYYQDEPRRLYSSFDRVNLWFFCALPTTGGRIDRGQFDHLREVENLVGCAMLIRAEAIRRVGMLDPDYFAYYEEIDWSLRMRKAGYHLLFVPQAVIHHRGGASLGRVDPPRIAYLKMRNMILLMRKRARPAQWLTFLPILTVVLVHRFVGAVLRGRTDTARALLEAVAWHLRPVQGARSSIGLVRRSSPDSGGGMRGPRMGG